MLISNNSLSFSFDEIHPEAKFSLDFQRTLRIPDDDKKYKLPPGLGKFPIKDINGTLIIPMYQSEALWINFMSDYGQCVLYPFAIRIATGNVSAITGELFSEELKENDYVVIPDQPWLDGFVVGDGIIRQFVAEPLGSGVSVEKQITGEENVGGIQFEIIPIKCEVYNKIKDLISQGDQGDQGHQGSQGDMSLAAGGQMEQQVFKDKYGLDVWDIAHTEKVSVRIVNSAMWFELTGTKPPISPITAKEYTDRGYPWFDYYEEKPALQPTQKMSEIKSVNNMPGGTVLIPDNDSVDESKQVYDLSPHPG